jgi:hypothetical protein
MKKTIYFLLITCFASVGRAQTLFECYNFYGNGTKEYIETRYQESTQKTSYFYYTSANKTKKELKEAFGSKKVEIEGTSYTMHNFVNDAKIYKLGFPIDPMGFQGITLSCINPDNTIQEYVLSQDNPTKGTQYRCYNANGSIEEIARVDDNVLGEVFHYRSSKNKQWIILKTTQSDRATIYLEFPNNGGTYILEQQDTFSSYKCTSTNGKTQIFSNTNVGQVW